jgi:1,4-alpha-glucan branching enzyme
MAVLDYQKHFARSPRGIWLAECAYNPGDDQILKDFGIEYFFTDTHGILFAEPRPLYGVHAPIECPSGVLAFGRDVESSRQVWSAHEGYPGDFAYREFYRDVGFDLEFDYIKPFIHESGHRLNTGIKYYRITSRDSSEKQPYNYQEAMARVAVHAAHFISCRERQFEQLMPSMDRPPIIVSPYDCELFGHWWYEGPEFIHYLLRKTALESSRIRLATPSDYVETCPCNQKATPSMSSWGQRGYNEVWLDESNAWIYPHLHKASQRMIELADRFPQADGLQLRALNQAAREVLLLQSSDWAFIMKTGTTVEYARKRTRDHTFRFNKLYEDIINDHVNENWLREVEWRDNIFPEIDYRIYRS